MVAVYYGTVEDYLFACNIAFAPRLGTRTGRQLCRGFAAPAPRFMSSALDPVTIRQAMSVFPFLVVKEFLHRILQLLSSDRNPFFHNGYSGTSFRIH